jgi:glutamyl-tRNA reductase
MHLAVVGISFRTAPIELRERLDFQARGVDGALRALSGQPSIRESVILSTCNRVEVYAACEELDRARGDLVSFIAQFHGIDPRQLTPHSYERVDLDAARHLFRVAAGLDSLVVGEPQILGQVKEALAFSTSAQAAGPVMHRLFHSSFATGKRVRSETNLGSGAVSIGYAAVALARKIFGNLAGRQVLVVGAGEMGKLTAIHMKAQGVHRITIVSRTMTHAAQTAEAIGGATVAPWDDMDAALTAADIVITATGATAPILTKAHIETVMRPRRNRPLFIIDIAVPRDVEGAAGEIEEVFLYNIDDLQATVNENLARRAEEAARAERIVGEEAEKFAGWFRSRGAIPAIVALRQRFDDVRRSELERLAFKLSAFTPEARGRVEEITRLIVEKILLTPTEQLKALEDPDQIQTSTDVLTRLFGLTSPSADQQPADPPREPASNVEPFQKSRQR